MGSPVEHGTVVIVVEKGEVIKNAGIQAYVNNKKRNKK
jgi:hypothetical protein